MNIETKIDLKKKNVQLMYWECPADIDNLCGKWIILILLLSINDAKIERHIYACLLIRMRVHRQNIKLSRSKSFKMPWIQSYERSTLSNSRTIEEHFQYFPFGDILRDIYTLS